LPLAAQLSASFSLLSAGLQTRWLLLRWSFLSFLLSPDPEAPRFGSLYERNSSSSEASLDLYSPAAGVVIGRGSWFGRENPTRKSLRDLRCPAPRGGRPDADGTCCSEPPGDGGERVRFLFSEIKIYRVSQIKRINRIYRKYQIKFK
jgi:hypothetical protein